MLSELVMAITASETDEGCSLTIPRIVVSWAPVLQQSLHTCMPAIMHFVARMHCHSPLWPDNTACQRQAAVSMPSRESASTSASMRHMLGHGSLKNFTP